MRQVTDFTASISIHAPAKGATIVKVLTEAIVKFQSTLPRRERRFFWCISLDINNFNPRSREGSDAGIC